MICSSILNSGKKKGNVCSRQNCKLHLKEQKIKVKQTKVKVKEPKVKEPKVKEPKVKEPKKKENLFRNSESQVESLCNHINTKTPLGQRVCRLFKESNGREIVEAILAGGGRKDHFDFKLRLDDGSVIQVEAKGSKRKCVSSKEPWYLGVQMYNGTGSRFSLAHKYSTLWYNRFIKSGYTDVDVPIPSYEEWSKDVFSQSKGKSEWTQAIRKKYPRGFTEERDDFVKYFVETITEEDKRILGKEVLDIASSALSEKQYWIQLFSDLETEISDVVWTPQVKLPTTIPTISVTKCKDVLLTLMWEDGRSLKTILRWGYNQGISNLRMDIK
jgi:hypothetical protein